MSAVEKWAKDKPIIIAICAPHAAVAIQDLCEEFQGLKLRRFAGRRFGVPALPKWFALYRSHSKTCQYVEDIWSAYFGRRITEQLLSIVEECQKPSFTENASEQVKQLNQEDWEGIRSFLKTITDVSNNTYEQEASKAPIKSSAEKRMRQLLNESPMLTSFFIFVAVPCWVLYRMHPTTLYRKARQGDIDAIEKILRLDQLMHHNSQVGNRIAEYRIDPNTPRKTKIRIPSTPTFPKGARRKNILLSIAGLLHALSTLTTKPLSAQDIYELIAAIDEDQKTNLLNELPNHEDPDSLRRSLEPDRNLWHQFINSGRRKAHHVSG